MPTVRRVYALEYVATLLGEDLEMLEAIVSNDDNLTYGSIVGVCIGPDESSTSLTDDGVEELSRMITCARRSPAEWDVSGGWRPRFSFWADCDTSFA